jgi:hypothetical protein
VIEHLFLPRRLPVFARAVLKPGGELVVTTPYHGYTKNLVISLLNRWGAHHDVSWDCGHIKFFSRKTLARLLGEEGFEPVAFRGRAESLCCGTPWRCSAVDDEGSPRRRPRAVATVTHLPVESMVAR